MALIKDRSIRVPDMEARRAFGVNRDLVGYFVSLYLIFDGQRCYTFFSQSSWIDNQLLMRESGAFITPFFHEVLVTPLNLPDLYNYLKQYDVS